MNTLTWLAAILLVLWIVARVVLAMTGAVLHLIWIIALVLFAIGIFLSLRR